MARQEIGWRDAHFSQTVLGNDISGNVVFIVLILLVNPPAPCSPSRYIFLAPPPTPHLSGLKTELVQAALAGGRRYFSCLIDAVWQKQAAFLDSTGQLAPKFEHATARKHAMSAFSRGRILALFPRQWNDLDFLKQSFTLNDEKVQLKQFRGSWMITLVNSWMLIRTMGLEIPLSAFWKWEK